MIGVTKQEQYQGGSLSKFGHLRGWFGARAPRPGRIRVGIPSVGGPIVVVLIGQNLQEVGRNELLEPDEAVPDVVPEAVRQERHRERRPCGIHSALGGGYGPLPRHTAPTLAHRTVGQRPSPMKRE